MHSRKEKQSSASSKSSVRPTDMPSVTDSAAARSTEHYEMVRDGFAQGFGAVKDVSESNEMLAPLKATCALMVRALEMTKNVNDNKKAWSDFNLKLKTQQSFLEKRIAQIIAGGRAIVPSLPALEQYHIEIQEILQEASKAVSYTDSGLPSIMRRIVRHRIDPIQVIRWATNLDDAHKRFTSSLILVMMDRVEDGNQYMMAKHGELTKPDRSRRPTRPPKYPACLLDQADPLSASIYGLDLSGCQTGTALTTLDHIRKWGDDFSTSKPILWLSGDKGTGKTAISVTMTREWAEKNILGGRFFFSRDAKVTSTIQAFCLAIARDMAAHFPSLQAGVNTVIGDRRILDHCGFEQQFQKMVIEPLERHEQPIIMVVDGLDNVSDDIMRDQLIACLLKELPRVPKLKVLFSSRALVDIEDSLGKSGLVERYDVHLPHNSDGTIHPDVSAYVSMHLEEFSEDERTIIATLSRGHFPWLSTAVVMLRESRQKEEVVQKILETDAKSHVDGLYCMVLKDAVHPMWPRGLRRDLLRVVLSALEPISLITLCVLLRIPDKSRSMVEILLRVLGSLLKSGDANLPIRIRHADFRDFCIDPLRSNEFYVDPTESHGFLGLASLQLLEPHLHYNILDIHLSGVMPWNSDEIKSVEGSKVILDAAVSYTSSYWPFHVPKAFSNKEVVLAVNKFLRNQFLCWAELMSWRGRVGEAIEGLSFMQKLLKSCDSYSADISELESLTHQALSFMRNNREIIEQSAMQVYCSALGFAVDDALLHLYQQLYEDKCPRVVVVQLAPEIHKFSNVWEISSDGLLIATVANDHTIELRLTSMGEADKRRFQGHHTEVTSLDFSLDGLLLASGSMDGQIRIWSLVTGGQIHLIEDIGEVKKVKFSPDGLSMLSISSHVRSGNQSTLRLWNVALATEPSLRFKYGESFTMATFSSDCRWIAAVAQGGLFEVRNVANGSLISTGKTEMRPSNIALSHDGERLVISNGAQIQLWDVADSPVNVENIEAKTSGPPINAYLSHNGEYLICGSSVWRVRTLPASVWSGLRLPHCLERYLKGPESLLSYEGGWISCAHPQGLLVQVPSYYDVQSNTPWRTHGSKIAFAPDNGTIVVVDCSALVS